MAEFDGRVALVTGGGSGIGKAIARSLAEEGARVMIADLNPESAAQVAREIGGSFHTADLSSREGCRTAVDAAQNELGPVSILINNAGFQHIDAIADFPEDTWDTMQRLMLTAPFLLMKYCWDNLAASGTGRVVNIASIHGLVASPWKSAYVSAKHGLLGLTRTAALEGGATGITVNAICPAYVMTPLVENQIADQARTRGIPESEVLEQVMLAPAAIKRPLAPDEIASLVVYLCSDKAGGVTGASWTIDLGWTAQ